MNLLQKIFTLILFNGVFGASVIPYTIMDNPLGNLQDLNEIRQDTGLDTLAETWKTTINTISDWSKMGTNTIGILDYKPRQRFDIERLMCPDTVLNFDGRSDIKFLLYNKYYTGLDVSRNMKSDVLIPNAPVKFIIHGFLNDGNDMIIKRIKDAYMSRKEDYNVIAVDWSKGSGKWLMNYLNCLITHRVVPSVGEGVAEFIRDLIEEHNVNILHVNVIGHSLGAHAAGFVGKTLQFIGYQLPIIVGLDPALPQFDKNPPEIRLSSTDADYVEVIHTDPGFLGYDIPLGTADFYPNFGNIINQPMCLRSSCCHAMSYEYFAESIKNPVAFEATPCENYNSLKSGTCLKKRSLYAGVNGVRTFMGGADLRQNKNPGVFYLETNRRQPYGRAMSL